MDITMDDLDTQNTKTSFDARRKASRQVILSLDSKVMNTKVTISMDVTTASEIAAALAAAVYNSRQVKLKQRKKSVATVAPKQGTIGDAMKQTNPESYKRTEEIVNNKVPTKKTAVENAVDVIYGRATDKERSDAINTFHAKNPSAGDKSCD